MSTKGTERTLAEQLGGMFAALKDAFADDDSVRTFFMRLGWFIDVVDPKYLAVAQAASNLATDVAKLVDSGADDLTSIKGVLSQTKTVYQSLSTLPAPAGIDATEFAQVFVERTTSLLITDFLMESAPAFYQALLLLGVVNEKVHPGVDGADESLLPSFLERQIVYRDIPDILFHPASIPGRFGWGTASFRFDRVAAWVVELLGAAGLMTSLERVDRVIQQAFTQGSPDTDVAYAAKISFFDGFVGGAAVDLAVALLDAPVDASHPLPGLMVVPFVPPLNEAIALGNSTTLTVRGGLDITKTFALVLYPETDPQLRFPFSAGTFPEGGLEVALRFSPATPSVLLGKAGASRLEVKGAVTRVRVNNKSSGFEVVAEVEASDLKAFIQAGDSDGLVDKLLGGKDLEIAVPAGVRWSNQSGLGLLGASGLEIALRPNVSFGPITIFRLVVAARGAEIEGDPALVVSVGADLSGTLGPVAVSAEEVGVALNFRFGAGEAGPFDFSVGFKPPTGVGIAINAGPITGGGFISLKDGRYAGNLELRIFEITVKAFGVIDTKMPDGSKGFSFVIVISAEFQPIQLGLGFTLNGVGGLLGINRTLSEKALTDVLSTKNADSILFPRNLTQNAPQIIEALATIFPPEEDEQVFGPMAKIGWGTPTLVTADLAVVLRLRDNIIQIIGLLTAALPKKEGDDSAALVDLHMFVTGKLDIPGKSFELNADLHDSTVGGYAVSGKMATRLRWGDRPNFLISLGGFHSNFQPPPDVPKLERLKVDLGITGNPTITLSGFLAVTSNTVQVGGELRFDAHKFGFDVGASVSAEAIFIFAPFSFDAVIDADVHVTFHGVGFTVRMHGHLSGPSPWHVDAKVCASLWFVSACLPISVTIGNRPSEELPTLDPWVGTLEPQGTPKAVIGLQDALQDARNWTALPGSGTLAVVSRVEPTVAAGATPPTLIDPLDAIRVHERVVPLETKAPIRRFGPVKSSGTATYHLESAEIEAVGLALGIKANVEEQFAPGQFFEIDRTKIVSASSFERHKAGYTLDPGADRLEGSKETTPVGADGMMFETYVVDSKKPNRRAELDELLRAGLLDGMLRAGPASVSGLFGKGTGTFVDLAAQERFDFKDQRYRVTDKGTKQPVTTVTPDAVSKVEAMVILAEHLTTNPANRGRYQVSRVDPTVAT